MTKGNNNQQRDAEFHFLCIIPTGKSQSAVNYHFALYPITMAVPALHWQNPWKLQYVSTKIQNNEQQGWSNRVQTTRVHCYFVFTWILLHHVLFLFASADAAAATHKNQLQWSLEAKAKSPLPQRADAKAATYRWDLPNRLHYIPNTICPTCYVSCLTGNMRKLNEETR